MNTSRTQAANISFVLLDNMLATSTTLPSEMLLAAQSAVSRIHKNTAPTQLHIRTLSMTGESVLTRSGLRWQPDMAISAAKDNQIIYIPGLWRNPRPLIKKSAALIEWLKQEYQNGYCCNRQGRSLQ